MSYNVKSIEAAVAEARAKGTERGVKFDQSSDIAVNFRKNQTNYFRLQRFVPLEMENLRRRHWLRVLSML